MSQRRAGRSGVLTFTTDFGTRDHYVGAMKGVVAAVAADVRVLDICHEIPSFGIAEGAYAIAQAYPYYPRGTVHVVVVDPGVGSSRHPLAVSAEGHLFVAPDNGVLSQVLEGGRRFEARRIELRHGLASVSRTFHGRDLFAPAGARLAAGLAFEDIGPPMSDPLLPPPGDGRRPAGRVLHVDRFGNVVTSFRRADLATGACLAVGGRTVCERFEAYASAREGALFLIEGSSGYVEVSLNQGSAAKKLAVRTGADVRLVGGGRRVGCEG